MVDDLGNSRGVPEWYEAGWHETASAGDCESDPKRQMRWGTNYALVGSELSTSEKKADAHPWPFRNSGTANVAVCGEAL